MTIINQITSFKISGFSYNGTDTQLNYTAGVIAGTAQPSKALVLNASSNITSGINSLTMNSLVTTNLTVNGTVFSNSIITNLSSLDNVTPGTASASKSLIVDSSRNINNINIFGATTINGTLGTASQPNITSVGTLTNLTSNGNLNIAQHNGTTTGLQLNSILVTSSAAELNRLTGILSTTAELNKLSGVTTTTTELNKLSGLTATTTELNKLSGLTATTNQLNFISGVNEGTVTASKAVVVDSSRNITNLGSLSSTGDLTLSTGRLWLANSNYGLSHKYTTGGSSEIVTVNDGIDTNYIGTFTNNDFSLAVNNTRYLTIKKTTGRVGINSTSPNMQLEVNSPSGNILRLFNSGGNSYMDITINNQGLTTLSLSGTSPSFSLSHAVNITSNTTSTNTTTGALIVTGGIGVSGAINIGGNLNISGNITNVGTLSLVGANDVITLTNTVAGNRTNLKFVNDGKSWELGSRGSALSPGNSFYLYDNTATDYRILVNSNGDIGLGGIISPSQKLDIAGGLRCTQQFIYGDSSRNWTGTSINGLSSINGAVTMNNTSVAINGTISLTTINHLNQITLSATNTNVTTTTAASMYIANAPAQGTNMTITNSYALLINAGRTLLNDSSISNSTSSGALIVTGGVGIGGAVNIGGALSVTGNISGTLTTANQSAITTIGTLTGLTSSGAVSITNNTSSSSTSTGALIVSGGVGIGGSINVGANSSIAGCLALTPTNKLVVTGQTSTNCLWHSTLDRRFGMRQIDADNFVMLCYSASSTYNDYITWNHNSGNPLMTINANLDANRLLLGTSTDTSRYISVLDGITTAGSVRYITLGSANSAGNQAEFTHTYQGDNNGLNLLSLGHHTNNQILNIYNSGNISIGRTNPQTRFDIQGSSTYVTGSFNRILSAFGTDVSPVQFEIQVNSGSSATTTNAAWLGTFTNNDVRFGTNNNTKMLLSAGGNLGINNLTPTYRLDVSGDINLTGSLRFSGTALTSSITELNILTGLTASTTQLNYLAGTTLGTITASKAITVDASSNINSVLKLVKTVDNSQITFTNGTSIGSIFHFTNGGLWFGTTSLHDTIFQTNAIERLRITSTGAINILNTLSVTGNISGTLATAAQPNITSIGTLTGLTSSGAVSITNNTASSSTTTGALIITGGVGIGGATNIGGALSVTGNITGTLATVAQPNITSTGNLTIPSSLTVTNGSSPLSLSNTTSSSTFSVTIQNSGGAIDLRASGTNQISLFTNSARQLSCTSSGVSIPNSTSSSSSTTGALVVTGGVGIGGALNIGGSLSVPYIQVGTSTDITRLFSALDNITTVGSVRSMVFGSANSAGNQAEFTYTYQGLNSTSNQLSLGFHSNNKIVNIYNQGNISIGRESQNSRVEIQGSSSFVTNDTNWNKVLTLYSSNASPIQFEIQTSTGASTTSTNSAWVGTISNNDLRLGTNNNTRMLLAANGNIGIGTTSPGFLLDVNGATKMSSCLINTSTSTWGGSPGYATRLSIAASANNEYLMALQNTNAAYNEGILFVGSTGVRNGGIKWGDGTAALLSASDYRIKCNITPLNQILNNIMKLNPVSYNMIEDTKEIKSNHLGFIAHELQNYFPELVSGTKDGVNIDGSLDIQTVNYTNLIPVLTKGIQEQQGLIETLQKENNELKNQIKNILDRLTNLEK